MMSLFMYYQADVCLFDTFFYGYLRLIPHVLSTGEFAFLSQDYVMF